MTLPLSDNIIDLFADLAEEHDSFGTIANYIAAAAGMGWEVGVRLAAIDDVVAADMDGDREGAMAILDELASAGSCGNWQVAAYEAWRRMDWTGYPNATRVDGVEPSDSHLLTLGRRIAAIESECHGDLSDLDYEGWRTGWGSMQPIADAVLAAHAMGDADAFEDLLDILGSAVAAGAVTPPRLRCKRYGVLGFAGGLGGFTGEVV